MDGASSPFRLNPSKRVQPTLAKPRAADAAIGRMQRYRKSSCRSMIRACGESRLAALEGEMRLLMAGLADWESGRR